MDRERIAKKLLLYHEERETQVLRKIYNNLKQTGITEMEKIVSG